MFSYQPAQAWSCHESGRLTVFHRYVASSIHQPDWCGSVDELLDKLFKASAFVNDRRDDYPNTRTSYGPYKIGPLIFFAFSFIILTKLTFFI